MMPLNKLALTHVHSLAVPPTVLAVVLAGAVGVVGLGGLVSCQVPRGGESPELQDNFEFLVPGFDRRAPADVAVLPVLGEGLQPPAADATWAKSLRDTLYWDLLHKGYAPLNPDYVDELLTKAGKYPVQASDVVPADLRSVLSADAFLLARIDGLDATTYQEARKAVVSGEVQLWDLATGTELWRTRRVLKVAPSTRAGNQKPGQSRGEAAIERFLSTCLDQLPPRRPH
ncbi:MAG: GNA1162 family protein [Planctomycetota bacterium]